MRVADKRALQPSNAAASSHPLDGWLRGCHVTRHVASRKSGRKSYVDWFFLIKAHGPHFLHPSHPAGTRVVSPSVMATDEQLL